MAEDKSKAERTFFPLNPSKLTDGSYAVQRFVATAPIGATPDDVLKPEFWTHVAPQITTRGAHIEVWADDNSWWVEVLVIRIGIKGLDVKPITALDLNVSAAAEKSAKKAAQEAKVPDGYEVRHVPGGNERWRVERKSDGEVLSRGHENKLTAVKWAQEHDEARRKGPAKVTEAA